MLTGRSRASHELVTVVKRVITFTGEAGVESCFGLDLAGIWCVECVQVAGQIAVFVVRVGVSVAFLLHIPGFCGYSPVKRDLK